MSHELQCLRLSRLSVRPCTKRRCGAGPGGASLTKGSSDWNVSPTPALSPGLPPFMEFPVAPRAYWKGYLKLSLVSCPIALYPATSERDKISFHQLNKQTGNRIKYEKVDAETGDEVDSADIIKGYQVGKGEYVEIEPEELEAIAIES